MIRKTTLVGVLAAAFMVISASALAAEKVTIVSVTAPSHSGSPATLNLIEQANKIQTKYKFAVEFRPGGLETVGMAYAADKPNERVTIVFPGFIDNTENGLAKASDWVPLFSQGDSCWMVVSNLGDEKVGLDSLKGTKELTVGGTGFGNAAHLTSLLIGEKYGIKIRYVVYKSNYDALVTMTSDNTINMLLERVKNVNQFKTKNPRIGMLASSCPTRHPDAPHVKSLLENGLDPVYVFQFIMAHKDMDPVRRKEVTAIFEQATLDIGDAKMREISDLVGVPYMGIKGLTSEQHIEKSFAKVRTVRNKFIPLIEAAKVGK